MATTTKTPGFNCRIAIFFQSDKNGRKCAYYWSGRLGDGRAIRMKLTEAELLVAQGQADLLPCHPLKAAIQEPEQVVVEPVIEEEKQAMTAIELYNLSNAFNNMRQSAKKRTIATMLENMACEHGYITIEGKMYHFNGDKLTRNYEESKCYWCNVAKPVLTDETITYTIVSRPTSNAIPFVARVLVPGQEVQEYDPQPSCWWMYTEGDLVNAVNKQFKGAWYLKPEVFDTRVAEQVQPIAEDITPEQLAEIMPFAQEYAAHKQSDRETFDAESRLETVQVQEKERREMEQDQAIMTQLLSNDGYNGYRIAESEYSRQYENGAYVPQYRSGDGHWRSYFYHTANRFSVGRGTKSYKSTSITYKTAKGAMGYLVKQGLELEPPSAGTI